MRDLHKDMLDAADALSSATDHVTYVSIAGALLERSIPGDHTFWVWSAFSDRRAAVRSDRALLTYLDAFIEVGTTHPGLHSYAARPDDLSPRRLSDVSSTDRWRNSPAYQEVCRPLDAFHQLNVLIDLAPGGRAISWTVTRPERARDFTDDHVLFARALQPLLRLSERQHPAALTETDDTPARDAGCSRPTPREAQVLTLLAQGQTAAAIARRCGITPRTVRKHLENLYAKLGCSDRLLAVQRARELGWLATGSGPP